MDKFNAKNTSDRVDQFSKGSNIFQPYPVGATKNKIEDAILANDQTTEQLVPHTDHDSYYFRALEELGIKLNQQQLEAVRHFTGPALVLAGAGSGKTRVLTSRAGYLLSVHKVNPKNILLLTFSKKAADEMKNRLASLPGLFRRIIQDVTSGTFHSIFLRLLRSRGYNQRILTSEKQKQTTIKIIMKEMGLPDAYEPETLLALLSSYKNNMIQIDELPEKTPIEKEMKEILYKYENWKRLKQFIDFDDILLEAYYLLKRDHMLLASMQNRFRFILCDEWQDTNPIQYELVKMIANPTNDVFVVGDDDQTIYTFNGAVISNILDFDKEYPNTKIFKLETNYRSTTSIVGLANSVISFNKNRHSKRLTATNSDAHKPHFLRPKTTDDEAIQIINMIVKAVREGKRSYKDFAILHRTANNSRAIFEQLVIHNIPFVSFSNGNSFYEQSIVKTAIDYLRLSIDPTNIQAIEGILPTLYLNREKTLQHIQLQEMVNPKKNLLQHLLDLPGLKPFQKQQISNRLSFIETLSRMKPVKAIKKIRSFYDKFLEADDRKNVTLHKEIVKETLSEIEASVKQFETIPEYVSFVDRIIGKNKQMNEFQKDSHADCVSLMTIHKSKGLEFPVVYLIGASEKILPHSSSLEASERKDIIMNKIQIKQKTDAAIEEERRLAYVAITRAQEELYISSPAFYQGENVSISRFILEPFKPLLDQVKKKKQNQTKSKKQTTTILAWDCTNQQCNAWMRITTYEDANQQEKECPLCQFKMTKTSKQINV